MIEAPDFLPLGSIVSLEGNPKKMMVISRGLVLEHEGKEAYCDYGFCLYPEGMLGDAVIYSNHESIAAIHARGFADEDDDAMCAALEMRIAELCIPRVKPDPLETW